MSTPNPFFIYYTNQGFRPNVASVKLNSMVIFKNNSSESFQPVSDVGQVGVKSGTCVDYTQAGSCKPVPPGSMWSATFNKAGIWGYHDQLKPSATMTITMILPPTANTTGPSLTVVYTDAGFQHNSEEVGVPSVVIFENKSSRSFWPISTEQSSSTPCSNDEQSGACEAIAPGASWSTTFNQPGNLYYYDKLYPSSTITLNAIPFP